MTIALTAAATVIPNRSGHGLFRRYRHRHVWFVYTSLHGHGLHRRHCCFTILPRPRPLPPLPPPDWFAIKHSTLQRPGLLQPSPTGYVTAATALTTAAAAVLPYCHGLFRRYRRRRLLFIPLCSVFRSLNQQPVGLQKLVLFSEQFTSKSYIWTG